MEDLIDIRGLDAITSWPLAIGWWIVISCALVILSLICWRLVKLHQYRRSWQYQSYLSLQAIERDLLREEHKLALQKLAIEMRAIAMKKSERESCAGLIGKRWLAWLQVHDPRGFAWEAKGGILVNAQYKPRLSNEEFAQVHSLIQTAKAWVDKC